MYNIDLKEIELENLIKNLEINNSKMIDSIDKIYNEFIKIDKKDWNSPEKTNIDNKFIPYLKKEKELLKNSFNSKNELLKYALASYRNLNEKIKNKASALEDINE